MNAWSMVNTQTFLAVSTADEIKLITRVPAAVLCKSCFEEIFGRCLEFHGMFTGVATFEERKADHLLELPCGKLVMNKRLKSQKGLAFPHFYAG